MSVTVPTKLLAEAKERFPTFKFTNTGRFVNNQGDLNEGREKELQVRRWMRNQKPKGSSESGANSQVAIGLYESIVKRDGALGEPSVSTTLPEGIGVDL